MDFNVWNTEELRVISLLCAGIFTNIMVNQMKHTKDNCKYSSNIIQCTFCLILKTHSFEIYLGSSSSFNKWFKKTTSESCLHSSINTTENTANTRTLTDVVRAKARSLECTNSFYLQPSCIYTLFFPKR